MHARHTEQLLWLHKQWHAKRATQVLLVEVEEFPAAAGLL